MTHTPGPWIQGWNGGVTGPTTPSTSGATVEEFLAIHRWKENSAIPYPKSSEFYDLVVSPEGGYNRVIAICPHPDGSANAALIARAPALPELLEALHDTPRSGR
jgi:hypothetical protein